MNNQNAWIAFYFLLFFFLFLKQAIVPDRAEEDCGEQQGADTRASVDKIGREEEEAAGVTVTGRGKERDTEGGEGGLGNWPEE